MRTVLRLLLLTVAVVTVLGAAPRNKEELTLKPEENALVLLEKYYPDKRVLSVFPSSYNKPGAKDGRFASVVTDSSSGFVKVVNIKGRDIVEIFEARYPLESATNINVGFLVEGEHIINVWPDKDISKRLSNFEIYSLTNKRSKPLFTLTKVENMAIDFVDDITMVIVQRWPNIINTNTNIKPSKAVYFILGYEPEKNVYRLVPHLTKLPGEELDVTARLNNQAVEHYRNGNLRKAADVFRKVVDMAGGGVAISRRNMSLVQREIEALEMQKITRGDVMITPTFDDARLSFFTGNYSECVNLITSQGRTTTGDRMVMLAVCYAQLGLWGDLDVVDKVLSRGDKNFSREYLSYMCDLLKGMYEEAKYFQYLKKLETHDVNHPNLIAHKALLLADRSRFDEAAKLIDAYLNKFSIPPLYEAKLVLIRYELAYLKGESLKMAEMEAKMYSLQKPDLSYLVEMSNYIIEEKSKSSTTAYPLDEFQERDLDLEWFKEYVGK